MGGLGVVLGWSWRGPGVILAWFWSDMGGLVPMKAQQPMKKTNIQAIKRSNTQTNNETNNQSNQQTINQTNKRTNKQTNTQSNKLNRRVDSWAVSSESERVYTPNNALFALCGNMCSPCVATWRCVRCLELWLTPASMNGLAHQHINTSARQHTSGSDSSHRHLLGDIGAVLGSLQANQAKVDLQGQDEFHQQGQRAKHKHQNPKEETLYNKISNSRSTAPGGCYVTILHLKHAFSIPLYAACPLYLIVCLVI